MYSALQATGEGCPDPITGFTDVDMGAALMANVQRCKYTKPTPVQRYSIPIGLASRDLMACAQTGSGKTGTLCLHGLDESSVLRARLVLLWALKHCC